LCNQKSFNHPPFDVNHNPACITFLKKEEEKVQKFAIEACTAAWGSLVTERCRAELRLSS